MVSGSLNLEQSALLFNMRANTVNSFKMCFTSLYRADLRCKLGCQDEDSLAHCMRCKIINDKLAKISKFNIDDIFATTEKQKNIVLEFTLRMNTRSSRI